MEELKKLRILYSIASWYDFIPEDSESEYIIYTYNVDVGEETLKGWLHNYEGYSMDNITDEILKQIDKL